MTLKILPVESWMKLCVDFPDKFEPEKLEIEPRLNKNGYYYDSRTKQCWYEYNGRAFDLESPNQFLFELQLFNHKPLSIEEHNALKVLIKHKLISKEQKELLCTDSLLKEIRLSNFAMKKFINNIKKGKSNEK